MKTKSYDYETASAAPANTQPAGPGFVVESTKVVRMHERFAFGSGHMSIGQMLDRQIADAIDRGEELQDLAVHFESTDWQALVASRFTQEA